jgi:Fe-Mn family superoxide dismutase
MPLDEDRPGVIPGSGLQSPKTRYTMTNRREFLKTSIGGGLSLGLASTLPTVISSCSTSGKGTGSGPGAGMGWEQSALPYGYNALEPFIDQRTMELHHTKHAAGYAKNLKDAMAAEKIAANGTLESLLSKVSAHSEKVRNNGGGHYNHELFWKCMKPNGEQQPSGRLLQAMESSFNSFGNFKTRFTEAAMTRFGSGWAWLYLDRNRQLQIGSTPNQDNPLMDVSPVKGTPLLGLDVWEHAYYLKYQNRRADYIDNWYRVVNWAYVQQRFEAMG